MKFIHTIVLIVAVTITMTLGREDVSSSAFDSNIYLQKFRDAQDMVHKALPFFP